MSRFKSLYDNSSHSYYNINHIFSNFNHIYNDIIKSTLDQLFFDDKLDYDQKMYLLNHRSCIEEDFLHILIEHVHNLTLNADIRQVYLDNINKFSTGLFHVNRDSHVNFRHYDIDDDDDADAENYIDDNDNDLNESDNDDYNDLENHLLDESEIEYYFNNNNNNINNRNINSASRSSEHQFESDFDDYDDD